jgi:hypothetical protein
MFGLARLMLTDVSEGTFDGAFSSQILFDIMVYCRSIEVKLGKNFASSGKRTRNQQKQQHWCLGS